MFVVDVGEGGESRMEKVDKRKKRGRGKEPNSLVRDREKPIGSYTPDSRHRYDSSSLLMLSNQYLSQRKKRENLQEDS